MIEKVWPPREASSRLIKPFKAVVVAANGRVSTGEVEVKGTTTVYLRHENGKRVYAVAATELGSKITRNVEVLGQGSISTEVAGGRLSVRGGQLDESGVDVIRDLAEVDLPRNPDDITTTSLFFLRGRSIIANVYLLAGELATAVQISKEEYDRAFVGMNNGFGCN